MIIGVGTGGGGGLPAPQYFTLETVYYVLPPKMKLFPMPMMIVDHRIPSEQLVSSPDPTLLQGEMVW